MGIIKSVFILLILTVFLHPGTSFGDIPVSERTTKIHGIIVCTCGKASYLITYGKHPITPMSDNERTSLICTSRAPMIKVGDAVLFIIRMEDRHKGLCPVTL